MIEDSIHNIAYNALDQAAWLAKRCGKFENMLTVVCSEQDWLLLFGTMAQEYQYVSLNKFLGTGRFKGVYKHASIIIWLRPRFGDFRLSRKRNLSTFPSLMSVG